MQYASLPCMQAIRQSGRVSLAFVDIQAPKSLRNGVDLARGLLASKDVFKSRGKRGAVLGGVQGEIAVREMWRMLPVTRWIGTEPVDKDKGSVGKNAGDARSEHVDWRREHVKSSIRSVCAARVRVSERILAKTDAEVRLQLRD